MAEDEEAGGVGVAEVPVREGGRESGQEETDGFGGEGSGDDERIAGGVASGEVEEGGFVVFDGDAARGGGGDGGGAGEVGGGNGDSVAEGVGVNAGAVWEGEGEWSVEEETTVGGDEAEAFERRGFTS